MESLVHQPRETAPSGGRLGLAVPYPSGPLALSGSTIKEKLLSLKKIKIESNADPTETYSINLSSGQDPKGVHLLFDSFTPSLQQGAKTESLGQSLHQGMD